MKIKKNHVGGGYFKLNFRTISLIFILILIISLIGVSFSYWRFGSIQNDKNMASSKCFKVNITNESDAITLNDLHPITDEEGLKSSSYSFTIQNTCDTYAMYQVNLEDILDDTITKRLNNKYIKISLNDGTPKVLNTYQGVTPTLKNADASFKLTSGSLSPKGSSNDSVSYNLKLWMDYDTPALDEVMSATFKSKISVVSVYTEEDKLTNNITITYNTKATDYTKDSETIDINATSTNYNLIEYSSDNITYTSIDIPSKDVTITKTYTEDKDETIYFRDEMGNLKSESVVLSKLDQTGPTISLNKSNEWGITNTIDITLKDNKSGLNGYALTNTETEPSEWTHVNGQEMNVTETVYNNGKYYIYAKDALGNISHTSIDIDKIDDIAPVITNITEQSEYGLTSTITINAKDSETGLKRYGISDPNNQITWTNFTGNPKEETITITAKLNGRYSIYVEDNGTSTASQYFNVTKVDMIKPTAKINACVLKDSITISATGSVDSQTGIAKYEYSIDGTTYYSSEEENYTFTGLNDGVYTAYLRVTDKAGLSTTVSTSAVVAYQNVYVSSSGDDSSGNGSKESPFASLSMAYVKVKSGGNIKLLSDITPIEATYFDTENKSVRLVSVNTAHSILRESNTTDTALLSIKNSNFLVIEGVIIDGKNIAATAPLISVNNSTLTLATDAIVRNAVNNGSGYHGGGIDARNSSTVNLVNGATVTGNKTKLQGGGLMIYGSTLNFSNGNVINNEITDFTTSGAGPGGIMTWESKVSIRNGTIANNVGAWGGGLVVNSENNAASLEMTGGTISGNTANRGAGILIQAGSKKLTTATISGGTIEKNTAKDAGAGIAIQKTTLMLNGGKICNNVATNNGGGMLIVNEGIVYMKNATISDNTANTVGGGIGLWSQGKFYLESGSIINNKAKTNGGGIAFGNSGTLLSITGGTITGNKCTSSNTYGGIFGGGDGEIYNYKSGTISGNTPKDSNK